MKKPGWLTAFCVFAIAFGGMGLFAALSQAGGALASGMINRFVSNMQTQMPNNPQQATQARILEESMAMSEKYKWVMVGLGSVNFVISGLLLVGGILALQLQPRGRKLLLAAFSAAALYECVALVPSLMMQSDQIALQQRALQQMQSNMPTGPAPPPQIMSGANTFAIFMTIGIVFAIGWVVAKLAAYIAGLIYLRRPAIDRYYSGEPVFEDEPEGDASNHGPQTPQQP